MPCLLFASLPLSLLPSLPPFPHSSPAGGYDVGHAQRCRNRRSTTNTDASAAEIISMSNRTVEFPPTNGRCVLCRGMSDGHPAPAIGCPACWQNVSDLPWTPNLDSRWPRLPVVSILEGGGFDPASDVGALRRARFASIRSKAVDLIRTNKARRIVEDAVHKRNEAGRRPWSRQDAPTLATAGGGVEPGGNMPPPTPETKTSGQDEDDEFMGKLSGGRGVSQGGDNAVGGKYRDAGSRPTSSTSTNSRSRSQGRSVSQGSEGGAISQGSEGRPKSQGSEGRPISQGSKGRPKSQGSEGRPSTAGRVTISRHAKDGDGDNGGLDDGEVDDGDSIPHVRTPRVGDLNFEEWLSTSKEQIVKLEARVKALTGHKKRKARDKARARLAVLQEKVKIANEESGRPSSAADRANLQADGNLTSAARANLMDACHTPMCVEETRVARQRRDEEMPKCALY